MSDDWDDYADDWDENEGVIIYAAHTLETLTAEVDLAGLDILDLGCGTGNLAVQMAEGAKHVVGVDTSVKMIEILKAKEIENIKTYHLELTSGVLSEKFDLITASSVFAFVPDFDEALVMLKGYLKPGGTIVQWDWLGSDDNSDFGFTPARLEQAYKQAGFDKVEITQPFSLKKADGEMKVVMCVARI
ncbi:MAG: class I SAM-dependent methyltransferase [Emcibacteraceae bacterium]|nr:class I SAM-dependent methyltransferase [Emcibacteraceae bacterium]MDG1859477.1 class I SAM-dependent methyltransferase [Emcibacteraceae bacterium]